MKHLFKFTEFRSFSKVFATLLCLITANDVFSQIPNATNNQPINTNNIYPFGTTGAGKKVQQIYLPGEMIGSYPGLITTVYFQRNTATTAGVTYSNLNITLAQTTQTVFTGSPATFATGTTVLNAATYAIPAGAATSWFPIVLTTPFMYDPTKTIMVVVHHSGYTGTGIQIAAFNAPAGAYRRIFATNPTDVSGNTDNNWYAFGFDLIPPNPPIANFLIPDTVYNQTPFTLVSTSQNAQGGLKWDLGNDGTIDGTATTLPHTFNGIPSVNPYPIELYAENIIGKDSIVKYVTVVNPSAVPFSDFIVNKNIVSEFDVSQFTDLSNQGANSWNWTVSPGIDNSDYVISNPNAQNPTITWLTRGEYTVCLTAGNALGAGNTNCKQEYIIVEQPIDNTLCSQTNSTRTFGNIYDSGGPTNNYFPNLSCGFLIEPCGGTSVTLNVSSMSLGTGSTLRIYNGTDATAPLLGSFTGTTLPTGPLMASSGKMYVFLQAAAAVNTGFAANWTSIIAPPTPTVSNFEMPDTAYLEIPFNIENTSTGVGVNYFWYFDYPANPFPAGTMNNTGAYLVNYFSAANSIVPGLKYNVCLMARSCANDSMICDSVLVINPFRAPEIDFSANKTRAFAGEEIDFIQNVKYGASNFKWRITPGTYSFQNTTTETSPNPSIKFFNKGLYTVELMASNSFGADSLEKYHFIEIVEYCIPALGTPVADVGISRVELEDINNTSTTGVTAYNDFLNKSTQLYFGKTYYITVERINTFNAMGRKVWIDFNSDGDFADAGELIASHAPDNSISYTGSFTVPDYDGSNEGTTRMRVFVAYNSSSFNSCSSIMIGEVEDYTVELIRDDVPPTLTLLGANPLMVELNSTYNDPGATANDNLEGDISSEIVVSNGLDIAQVGRYTIRYNVKDASGNSAVELTRDVTVVVDLTPPVVTLNGANPLHIPVLTPFADPGVTATDNYSGNLSGAAKVTGTVNTNVTGTYTITYSVKDAFGLITSISRDVIVEDLVKPIINPVPGNTTFVQVLTPFIDPVTVTDNYDLNLSAIISGGPVHTNSPTTYTLTYNAVDNSGNAASPYVLTVMVGDQIPPVLIVNSPDVIVVEVYTPFNLPAATYSDDYSSVTFVTVGSPNMSVLGSYPVIYRATDGAGNKTDRTITVKVVDTTKPVLKVLGQNPTNILRWTAYVDPNPPVSIMDNYNNPGELYDSLIVNNGVDATIDGSYFIWYKVKDRSGNWSDSVARLVHVIEPVPGTGIHETAFNGTFEVYPNPGNGVVNVHLALKNSSDSKIEIFNVIGELIKVYELPSLTEKLLNLDLSTYSEGIYYVRFKSEEQTATQKIIISK